MIRFIKKSFIFSIILALILAYINNLYINTDRYKSINSTEKFDHVPKEIEVANLGTSHAQYAFLYDDIDKTSFNFAMSAQRLHYDEKILEKYIENFSEGSTLFIPISYISFYLGYEGDNFEEYNKMYYKILGYEDIKNATASDYLKYSLLPILTAESNIKYIFVEDEREYRAWYEQDRMNYTISIEEMIEESRETAGRHHDFIKDGEKNKDEFVEILDNIIQICIENNIEPVITTTPLTKYYNEHFSQEFLDGFRNTIENLLVKYPDIKYLDYSHDERFIDSPEYFFDSSHLNITGAKMFTDIILNDINRDDI